VTERNSTGLMRRIQFSRDVYWAVASRKDYPVRKTTLASQGPDRAVRDMTPGERMAMVWTLSVQAWQFKEPAGDEPRLRRHVVRIVRGGR
jgi:hypothetical protein